MNPAFYALMIWLMSLLVSVSDTLFGQLIRLLNLSTAFK